MRMRSLTEYDRMQSSVTTSLLTNVLKKFDSYMSNFTRTWATHWRNTLAVQIRANSSNSTNRFQFIHSEGCLTSTKQEHPLPQQLPTSY